MIRRGIAILAVALAACQPRPKPENPLKPDRTEEEGRPIDPTEWSHTWEDLVKHTQISTEGKATQPSASKDGKFFVYATTETAPKPQICMRATNGVAPTQLTTNNGTNLFPRVSPDGRRFAYASDISGNFDLYVARIDAPASVIQVTTSLQDDIAPSWSG